MGNINDIIKEFLYTAEFLKKLSIRQDYTAFPSGAIMLDIWYEDRFFVIQFDPDNYVGISEITSENVGFDTIPDKIYYKEDDYKNRLTELFVKTGNS